jgi:hypothetical protein
MIAAVAGVVRISTAARRESRRRNSRTVVALDVTSRREVVLHEHAARDDEREDRLPVVRAAPVREYEPERPAAAEKRIRVALEHLDVRERREA